MSMALILVFNFNSITQACNISKIPEGFTNMKWRTRIKGAAILNILESI